MANEAKKPGPNEWRPARQLTTAEVLAENAGLIPNGVKGLKALQGLQRRNYWKEKSFAKSLNKRLQREVGPTQTGVSSFQGEGVMVGNYPEKWRGGRKPLVTSAERIDDTDVDLQPHVNALHGFVRGDKVGNAAVLGKEWYLMFGRAQLYLIPVKGFRGVTVAPYTFKV